MSIMNFLGDVLRNPVGKFLLYDAPKFLVDTVTGNAIPKIQAEADRLVKQDEALTEAEIAQKEIDAQKRMEASSRERNTAIANRQMELSASNISEQSRAAAIEKFQAESSGDAALGISGMGEGSSPYLALESQVAETDRKIGKWLEGARTGMDINAQQLGGSMEASRFRETQLASDSSILGKKISAGRSELDSGYNNFGMNAALEMGAGLIGGALNLYSLGSAYEGLKLMGGVEGIGKFMTMDAGSLTKGSSLLKLGGAQQYAAATGDTGPLTSMFEPGGAFGSPLGTTELTGWSNKLREPSLFDGPKVMESGVTFPTDPESYLTTRKNPLSALMQIRQATVGGGR
jgi:hypothetical protein